MRLDHRDHGNKLQQQQLQLTVDLNLNEVLDTIFKHCQQYLLVVADKNHWFDRTNYFLFKVCNGQGDFTNNILLLNKSTR